MKSDKQELSRMFNKTYIKIMKDKKDDEQLIDVLNKRVESYLDKREQKIRNQFEIMINDLKLSTEQWKQ